MPEYSSSIDINASPRAVWNILADVERWPDWTPTMTRVTKLTAGPLAKGTKARIIQPRLLPAVWRVTEIHEGRDFTWVCKSPGLRVTAGHSIHSTPTGARVTLSIRFSGLLAPILSVVLRRLNRRYLAAEARGLKARSEEPAPAIVK
jgi:hypothetical protein